MILGKLLRKTPSLCVNDVSCYLSNDDEIIGCKT